MTHRDVSLPVAAQPSLDGLVSLAARAEGLGYDRAWLPETWGRDAVTTLALAAERTDTIGLGTSIVNAYSRSPALLGQTAATLQEASDGRFRLGLGPSGPAVIENWHGVEFGNPLKRTRETVEVTKRVLSGEPVSYDGDLFDLDGFRLRQGAPDTPVPVDAAGMGPKAVELCGRFADGWHALMLTPDGLRDRLDAFRRGAALGDRDADDLRVTVSLTCCAMADAERARDLARRHVVFYVAAMGDFYRNALAAQGHGDVADAVCDRWRDDDREGAKRALDDDLLDDLAAAGSPERARGTVERFASVDGVDAVAVSFPRAATDDDIRETMAAVAP
ncbi:TIGR04024 family LLM class F420-dependent oxidoreductase [Halobaculum lipolyticum]|uniref:TIGR04024 family LLM class F420-dependent oxidoreductase n=1 Tax=Halobaculum lipolyticum TaxID=3032001 RepID=A0ABD5WCJ8_9EURY|nr:TIGR04024 family LLM class F420-dependent oxidoreductase [Halobaculum sp. DT31]